MGQDNKTIRKTKGNYVFPNFLAKLMSKVSQRTQMESEMMSIAFILVGVFVMGFLTLLSGQSLFVKIVIIFNLFAAFILLSSRLVTSFQQYNAFLAAMGLLEEWNKPTQELNECKEV